MKNILLLIFTITVSLYSAQVEKMMIENQNFSIVTETYDIYNSKGEVMKLYKEEDNATLTYVLGMTIKDTTGTCSNKRVQEGSYEIKGKNITLYSFWYRRGDVPSAPYGARITQYELLDNYTATKRSSYIYIESEVKNYDDTTGMQYLFKKPNTAKEKELFKNYITDIERTYKGDFLFGDASQRLIEKVKEALDRKRKSRWKN
jgi:hypothetical protein